MQWVHQGDLVYLHSHAVLPNPLTPECPKVEIMSTKCFLHDTLQSSTYGDVTWFGILQLNADISDHRSAKHAAYGLAAHAILGAADNYAGNIAGHAAFGAIYYTTGRVVAFSIYYTIYSAPAGSKTNKLALTSC